MRALVFLSLLVAGTCAAQPAQLVLREAILWSQLESATDTLGLERATVPAPDVYTPDAVQVVYLGDVLMRLGPGTIREARAQLDSFDDPALSLSLTPPAAKAFAAVTSARVGKAIALVLNGRVLSAPTVMQPVTGGKVSISGLALEEAEEMADAIREASGAPRPEVASRKSLRSLRTSLDFSTPEAAALSFTRAHEAGDPLSIARTLHPATLADLRAAADAELVSEGDSVRWRDDALSSGSTSKVVLLTQLFPEIAPEAAWTGDEIQVALWLTLVDSPPLAPLPRASGVVTDGEGRAFVVMAPETPGDVLSEARVLEVRRTDGLWRVVPPTTWLRGE